MSTVDTRQMSRDSLFVLAKIKVEGDLKGTEHRVKVRNLSSGGMMAEGNVKVVRGSLVTVELRNIGWVDGTVAWKQDDRFGIAFLENVDHKLVLAPPPPTSDIGKHSPRYVRPPLDTSGPEPSKLRKI
ncbi:PilZ domain-containing protein [Altererythrobacter sp. CC-YST694]|uniref:PilZ domain-containing protein n=1 Tax=Altererythrobacter sp. CC-YST694 TaxID=2755038 RepID=UPI001D00BF84|nr:PilZ domain-containing protein [Altererythrobacter sp. CC-YST694]MCB5425615.1 PilZ domain-containing protein [Altererythrobacter sp. CC-YST694]